MIIILKLVIHQLLLATAHFQKIGQFSLAPLCPDKVGALQVKLLFRVLIVLVTPLTNEALGLLTMPPRSAFDDLSDGGVVVTPTNVEFEIITALLRLDIFVGFVEHPIQFLH